MLRTPEPAHQLPPSLRANGRRGSDPSGRGSACARRALRCRGARGTAAPAVVPPGPATTRAPRGRRRTSSLVGLEIEPGQLVAVKSHVNGRVVVEQAVGTPIAPNLVRDGEVTDVDGLSSALADLFDGSGLDRRVRIGIANQRIVMRQIELPPILDPKELESAVRFQAQDEIPMPIESVVLDYHPLGIIETDGRPAHARAPRRGASRHGRARAARRAPGRPAPGGRRPRRVRDDPRAAPARRPRRRARALPVDRRDDQPRDRERARPASSLA